jgi:LmbE family N-acetylglucosaminyl deacetylase
MPSAEKICLYGKRILLVSAHPDDMDMAIGASIADATGHGAFVRHLVATDGEEGSLDHSIWSPHTIGQTRVEEQLKASAKLGVQETSFLGYRDGTLNTLLQPDESVGIHDDPIAPVRARLGSSDPILHLRRHLLEFQPEIIITYGPGGLTGHTDHSEIAYWVMTALLEEQESGNLAETILLGIAETENWIEDIWIILKEKADATYGGPPQPYPPEALVLDRYFTGPDEWLLEIKLDALMTGHASQFKILVEKIGREALVRWAVRESLTRWV